MASATSIPVAITWIKTIICTQIVGTCTLVAIATICTPIVTITCIQTTTICTKMSTTTIGTCIPVTRTWGKAIGTCCKLAEACIPATGTCCRPVTRAAWGSMVMSTTPRLLGAAALSAPAQGNCDMRYDTGLHIHVLDIFKNIFYWQIDQCDGGRIRRLWWALQHQQHVKYLGQQEDCVWEGGGGMETNG